MLVSIRAGEQFPSTSRFSGEVRLSRFRKMLFFEHICRDGSQWCKGICMDENMCHPDVSSRKDLLPQMRQ